MKKELFFKKQNQLCSTIKFPANTWTTYSKYCPSEITSSILTPQISYLTTAKAIGVFALMFASLFAQKMEAQIIFAEPVVNPFGITVPFEQGFSFPKFADMDADGDLDMMCGDAQSFRYYENSGTTAVPEFSEYTQSPFGLPTLEDYGYVLELVDFDADGDTDILYVGIGDAIFYLDNVGTPEVPDFAAPVIIVDIEPETFALSISIADLDNDNDIDILSQTHEVGFQYHENIGTAENFVFAQPVLNPFELDSPEPQLLFDNHLGDLDNDGDSDLIFGTEYGAFSYFENTGNAESPNFAEPQINPFNLSSVENYSFPTFVDIDADGDLDLFVGEEDSNIQYFENITPIVSGLEGILTEFDLNIYPNPIQDVLRIETTKEVAQLELFNLLGQSILHVKKPNGNVNMPDLAKGAYEAKITLEDGSFAVRKLIKE